ncbi:MAG: DSD1 family PLP-dependent enzyme [Sedimentisphaerales bacterium]|nr:DSD1 family PLP-dependent enzyme [Sedimentisphaerales bacterium]
MKTVAENLIGRHKSELMTPCLLLDIEAVDKNINKMAAFFSSLECKLRPHAKSHKLPLIAQKQIEAGAIGITCAKLQDAEAFINAGIDNVLIANEIVGSEKIRKLIDLSGRANIIVCVDSFDNTCELSLAAEEKGQKLDILIEVDTGLNRCGVAPGKPVLNLLQKIMELNRINFRGLMGYEGGLFIMAEDEKIKVCRQRNRALVKTKELLQDKGFTVEIVSAGGANTYNITGLCPGITEIQPGSYVTMDDWNKKYGLDFEQAITILTTVISRPVEDRAVTDAGLKAISTDHGLPRIINRKGITVQALNEEHGKLTLSGQACELAAGDKLEIAPTHGCTTIPLYDKYIAIKDSHVVDVLDIISRGAVY